MQMKFRNEKKRVIKNRNLEVLTQRRFSLFQISFSWTSF